MNNKGVRQKLFQPTSTEKGKREKMRRKGVCKITQDGGHLGWGCLVCDSPQVKNTEYFIITSSKAIPKENSDAKKYQKYQVEFEKPSKERKSFQLGEIAKTVHHDVASGLVVIAIDSKSPQLNHGLGKLRERCSVLNDLPKIGCKESGSQFFYIGDKRYDVDSDGESLKVSNHDFSCTERCSVLLEDNNMDVKAVGVINLEDNRQRSSVPYWLQESSLKAILGASTTSASDDTDSECRPKGNQPEEQEKEGQNILTEGVTTTKEPVAAVSIDKKPSDDKGEAISSTIDSNPVVYSERSHTPESLQTPAVNSQETTEPPSNGREAIDSSVINSYEDKEISTASGQPRDQLHVVVETHAINNNKHSKKEEQTEGTATDRDDGGRAEPQQFRSDTINGQVLYIGNVADNATLMDELARCLDREYKVVKYWKHLAWELGIPADVQKGFEIYYELSPTVHLFQFLSTNDPHLRIGKLKLALKDIHRNDLIEELKDFSDFTSVSEVFNGEPSLLDSIALKLDSAKRPVGNWRSLAGKLISSGQMFQEFDAQLHSSENPTSLLFRYLQTSESFNKLTVGDLKKYMQDMKRMDVLAALAGVKDDDLLADVFSPDSDLLNSVSNLLNRKIPGVKNWRHLANKLGVPNKVYEDFDPDASRPRHRPTKMVLEWLRSEHPNMTVDQLRTAVKKIDRADALEILDGYLFSSRVHREGASPGEQIIFRDGSPYEQKPKVEAKSGQSGDDEVDIGSHTPPVLEISPSTSQREIRLLTAVTDLPLQVYSKLCLILNIRRFNFDDFRMLGEKVGLKRYQVEYLGEQENPTDRILQNWSSTGKATVKKLIEILGDQGFKRNDVREILNDWVNEALK